MLLNDIFWNFVRNFCSHITWSLNERRQITPKIFLSTGQSPGSSHWTTLLNFNSWAKIWTKSGAEVDFPKNTCTKGMVGAKKLQWYNFLTTWPHPTTEIVLKLVDPDGSNSRCGSFCSAIYQFRGLDSTIYCCRESDLSNFKASKVRVSGGPAHAALDGWKREGTTKIKGKTQSISSLAHDRGEIHDFYAGHNFVPQSGTTWCLCVLTSTHETRGKNPFYFPEARVNEPLRIITCPLL